MFDGRLNAYYIQLTDAINDPMNGPSLKLLNRKYQQTRIISMEPTT